MAARQGWSDVLAVFSLAGPVFLVTTSLAADLTLYPARRCRWPTRGVSGSS